MRFVQYPIIGSLLLSGLMASTALAAPNDEGAPRRRGHNTPDNATLPDRDRYSAPRQSELRYAEQNPSGFYLGLAPGASIVDGREDTPSSYKKESFGAKAFMGVQFAPMWNLEWGYIDFGKGKSSGSYAQTSKGIFMGVVTAFGLGSSNFDLLLRYGASYIENHETDVVRISRNLYATSNDKERKLGGLLGVGGRYRFGPTYSLGLDIDVGADTSALISLSNRWQF